MRFIKKQDKWKADIICKLKERARAQREAAQRRKSQWKVKLGSRNFSRSNHSWRMTPKTMHHWISFVCGPKFTKFFSPKVERVVVDWVFLRFSICRSVPEIFVIKVESCQKSWRNLDVLGTSQLVTAQILVTSWSTIVSRLLTRFSLFLSVLQWLWTLLKCKPKLWRVDHDKSISLTWGIRLCAL